MVSRLPKKEEETAGRWGITKERPKRSAKRSQITDKVYYSFKDLPMQENRGRLQEGKQILTERFDATGMELLPEAAWEVNGQRGKGIIRNLALCGGLSKNKRRYVDALAKADAERKYENKKVFFRHGDDDKDMKEELWGRTANTYFDEANVKERGDIYVINHHEAIFRLMESAADLMGLSHEAHCKWKPAKHDWIDIQEITDVVRIGLVDTPGTNKNMYESKEVVNVGEEKEEKVMTLEELKKEHGLLLEEYAEEVRANLAEASEVDALRKENERLKQEIKEKDDAAAIRETEARLETILAESRLPDGVKNMLKESAKGKVIKEEDLKAEVERYERICEEAVKGIDGGPKIPETKANDDSAEALKELIEKKLSLL